MSRRRRLRTFTLWTGAALSVLVGAVFVASAWWQVAFQVPTSRGPAMYVVAGSVMFTTDQMLTVPVSVAQSGYGLSRWNGWGGEFWRYLELPLYAVFAAAAIPTLFVWRFWPKPVKPGHCRCGYDLTGNVSGRCPECGKAV
jgi:hypothetical protein